MRRELTKAGWEGDGEIGVIWLPPFVDVGVEDTWGTYLWHVKQSNNGISWLASDATLSFQRLREQNESSLRGDRVPVGIMFAACTILQRQTLAALASLSRRIKALPKKPATIMREIQDELTQVVQGRLVSELNCFLDDCYLQVLLEVLDNGNTSKLKLGKFKASLSPMAYLPEQGIGSRNDPDSAQWFTIKGLIKDVWNSYRFEPFKQKTEMLFKACEYQMDAQTQRMITKHVQLRNCIQHHEGGTVTPGALSMAGVREFIVLGSRDSKVKLGPGAKIFFPIQELFALAKALDKLATSFDSHTQGRIQNKHWFSTPAIEKSRQHR